MATIKITIKDNVSRKLRAYPKKFEKAMRLALRDSIVIVEGSAIGTHMQDAGKGAGPRPEGMSGPLRIVTGALSRAVAARPGSGGKNKTEVKKGRFKLTKTISAKSIPYAAIHEYGGTIRAKNKPFLRFRVADGTYRMKKSVNIPARPYLKPALEDSADDIQLKFVEHINTIKP